MDAITEKVARAICEADLEEEDVSHYFVATEHGGDCTNQAHTCLVCLADFYRNGAQAAIAAHLEALRERLEAGELVLTDGTEGRITSRFAGYLDAKSLILENDDG